MPILGKGGLDDPSYIQRSLIPQVDGLTIGDANHKFLSINALELNVDQILSDSTDAGLVAYNTVDQTTNYERFVGDWDTNVYELVTQKLGTGTSRAIRLGAESGASFAYFTVQRAAAPFFNFTIDSIANAGPYIAMGDGTASGIPNSSSSGTTIFTQISPWVNQSGTAGYKALYVNVVESAFGSGSRILAEFALGGVYKFQVFNSGFTKIAGALTVEGGNINLSGEGTGLVLTDTGAATRGGIATLSGGTIAVATTSAVAGAIVLMSPVGNTNAGLLSYVINPGVGFTITSANGADARAVGWMIVDFL